MDDVLSLTISSLAALGFTRPQRIGRQCRRRNGWRLQPGYSRHTRHEAGIDHWHAIVGSSRCTPRASLLTLNLASLLHTISRLSVSSSRLPSISSTETLEVKRTHMVLMVVETHWVVYYFRRPLAVVSSRFLSGITLWAVVSSVSKPATRTRPVSAFTRVKPKDGL